MNIHELETGESIVQKIEHRENIPLRFNDWAKIGFPIILLISGPFCLLYEEYIAGTLGLAIGIYGGIVLPILRRRKVKRLDYVLTSKRFIFYDKKIGCIDSCFYLSKFPSMTLRVNAFGHGYIILGKQAPTMGVTNYGIGSRGGIEFRDHSLVIDNLKNAKEVYDLIQSKIEVARQAYTQQRLKHNS